MKISSPETPISNSKTPEGQIKGSEKNPKKSLVSDSSAIKVDSNVGSMTMRRSYGMVVSGFENVAKQQQLSAKAAEQFGKTEALIFEGKRWNFEEFSDKVDDIARSLLAIGIKPGEKVSLWMMNRPEWLFINYAVAKIGAILVPLNTRYRTKDVAYAINQSDSVAWIFQAQSGPINYYDCLLYTSPSPRDPKTSRMPSSA